MKKRKTKAEVVEVKSSSEHEEEEEYDENITAKDHSNGSLSTTTNTIINHRSASQGKTSEECLECFSMPRVRRLMKTQADLRTNRESLFLISATTAMFLQQLVQDAYEEEPRPHKKSGISYKNLSSVVSKQKRYEFLSDFVPERLKAKVALSERAALEEEMG
ncbi:DNA polymerase II subunit B3-1-like isoform X1 [Aristolochia californica]|uniref:DNA polymerase II subunit B3-1-like isoform X1 n=1 Tax=Aristolochia californica TaxID=171875 RepID=UPI0035DF7B0C